VDFHQVIDTVEVTSPLDLGVFPDPDQSAESISRILIGIPENFGLLAAAARGFSSRSQTLLSVTG